MVNDVGLIREVNFMQSLLSQEEQKEEQLDISRGWSSDGSKKEN